MLHEIKVEKQENSFPKKVQMKSNEVQAQLGGNSLTEVEAKKKKKIQEKI